jgi:hypothetical protein
LEIKVSVVSGDDAIFIAWTFSKAKTESSSGEEEYVNEHVRYLQRGAVLINEMDSEPLIGIHGDRLVA